MKLQAKLKRFWLFGFGLAVIMVLTALVPLTSYAAEEENFIVIGEYSNSFELKTNKENIFKITEAAPGDKYEGEIILKNTGKDKMEISIVDISSNISDTALYNCLFLKISKDGAVIYEGIYGKTPDPVTGYITVDGNREEVIDIEVEFLEYSGNEFQGKILDTIWTFEADYHNKEKIKTGVEVDSIDFMDTGYSLIIGIAIMLICIAGGVIIFIRKKEEKNE